VVGWRISALGFLVFASADAWLLLRLYDFCKSNLTDLSLLNLPLVPSMVYLFAVPTLLVVHRNRWSARATVGCSLAGLAIQLIILIAGLIPSYM
jgi:hypothetical protein